LRTCWTRGPLWTSCTWSTLGALWPRRSLWTRRPIRAGTTDNHHGAQHYSYL
jgi:hypothetical protein